MIIMINDLLNYDLKIYQNNHYFKFSIDSVLLAEFVNINYRAKSIIDLCTGNAPIPMILSTKFDKKIVGVELQKEIYDLAIKSLEVNNIKNIQIFNCDVNNYVNECKEKFDIVTCNPPYFKVYNNSKINENEIKAIARHEIKFNLDDMVNCGSKLLRYSGSLYFVHRCERIVEIIDTLKKYNFGLKRIQCSDSCFILVEAKYMSKDDLKVIKPIFINKYLEEI